MNLNDLTCKIISFGKSSPAQSQIVSRNNEENGEEGTEFSRMKEYLDNHQTEEILKEFNVVVREGLIEEYITGIFRASIKSENASEKRRYETFFQSFKAIQGEKIVDKKARNVVNLLLGDTENLSCNSVPPLLERLLLPLQTFELAEKRANGCLMLVEDLLGKLLAKVALEPSLKPSEAVAEDLVGVSGAEYRKRVITKIQQARWPPNWTVGLCKALKDMQLDEAQLLGIAKKIAGLISSVPVQELPLLSYQALLLAHSGHQNLILGAIIAHMDALDQKLAAEKGRVEDTMEVVGGTSPLSRSHLRELQGNVLIHFNFAAKQNHTLGKHLLKMTSQISPMQIGLRLSPFRMAFVLSLARISRFEFQALKVLVDCMLGYFCFWLQRSDSEWLACGDKLLGCEHEDYTHCGTGAEKDPLRKALEHLTDSCMAWDHILQSLIGLGQCMLAEGVTPSSAFGASPPPAHSPHSRATGGKPAILAKRFVAHLGRDLLTLAFQSQHVQKDVLKAAFDGIIARAPNMTQCLLLLKAICEKHAGELVMSMSGQGLALHCSGNYSADDLKETLGYLPLLPLPAAKALLRSTQPLLLASPSLQVALVIPLRKALFSREERVRLVGLMGLRCLLTLGNAAVTHYSLSQHSLSGSASDEGVLTALEGFGLLRRCLGQQLGVRQALYQELVGMYIQASQLANHVVDLLKQHFSKYYAANKERASPFLLGTCIDASSGQILEPLPSLLLSVTRLYVLGEKTNSVERPEESSVSSVSVWPTLCDMLQDVVHRLSEAELEDFDIDKTTSFSQVNEVGRSNDGKVRLLCGLYEAAMNTAVLLDLADKDAPKESRACSGGLKESTLMQVMRLFERHTKLLNMFRCCAKEDAPKKDAEKDKGKDKAKNRSSGRKVQHTHLPISPGDLPYLGLPAIKSLLLSLIAIADTDSQETAMSQDSLKGFVADSDFQRLLLETCLGHLQILWDGGNPHEEFLEIGGPRPEADIHNTASAEELKLSAEKNAKSISRLAPALLKWFQYQVDSNLTSVGMKRNSEKDGGGSTGSVSSKGKGKLASGGVLTVSVSLAERSLQVVGLCVKLMVFCSTEMEERCKRTSRLLHGILEVVPVDILQSQSVDDVQSISKYVECFIKLAETQITTNLFKEAELLLEISTNLAQVLTPEVLVPLSHQLSSLLNHVEVSARTSMPPGLARLMTSFALQTHTRAGNGMPSLMDCATAVQKFLGPPDDDSQDPHTQETAKKILSSSTIGPFTEEIIGVLENLLEELEYSTRVIINFGSAKEQSDAGDMEPDSFESQAQTPINQQYIAVFEQRETFLCNRMLVLLKVFDILVGSALTGRSSERICSCTIRLFKLNIRIAKARIATKLTWLSSGFKELCDFSGIYVKHMEHFLRAVQNDTSSSTTQHKIAKQSRLVPEMIYQMEQRDLVLLRIGKLCKDANISRWVRRTTARDFKIDAKRVFEMQEIENARKEKKRKLQEGKKSNDDQSQTQREDAKNEEQNNSMEEEDQDDTDGNDSP